MTPDHDLSRRFGDAMADRQLPQSSQAIVLAVSGGADSLGMVALITSWYARLAVEHNQPLPSLTAMIVDHGLRDDSTTEAEQVKSMLESAGINTYVAQITDTPPEHGLAEWARKKRYDLLTAAAMRRDAVLMTAHHADDQLETVEMRLSRGSGLRGLAAIRPETGYLGVRLIRPCLGFTKSELARAAHLAGFDPVLDPTNMDQRYQRPRLRANRQWRGQSGVTDQQLMSLCDLSARLMEQADQSISAMAPDMFSLYPQGYAVMTKQACEAKGFFLIASYILRHMGVKPYLPSDDALANVRARLLAGDGAVTLAGCEWRWDSRNADQVIIYREPEVAIAPICLPQGHGMFDRRWRISYPHPVKVEAIGAKRFAQVKSYLPHADHWPRRMARVFWSLPVLIDENSKNLAHLDRLVLDDGAIFPHVKKVENKSCDEFLPDFSIVRFLGSRFFGA